MKNVIVVLHYLPAGTVVSEALLEKLAEEAVVIGVDWGSPDGDKTVIATRGDDGYFEGIMSGRIPNPLLQELRSEPTKPEPFKPFTRLREEKAQWKRERRAGR